LKTKNSLGAYPGDTHVAFDRRHHWERVYRTKSPLEVSWYQKQPVLSLKLINDANLPLDAAIIDVGGGASTLVDCLLKKGYSRLAVLDISTKALAYSKERLGKKAAEVEWYPTDIVDFKPPHLFSLWHDRAVFHFLTDLKDRRQYLRVMKQSLKPSGQVIMASFAVNGPKKCSGLNVVQYDSERMLTELGENFSLVEEKAETHVTPGGAEQKFSWFRLLFQPYGDSKPSKNNVSD